MAVAKSPFYVVQNFLSGKHCEDIVDSLGFFTPDVDDEGHPIKMVRHHDDSEELIYHRFEPLIPKIEEYFMCPYQGTAKMNFEFYSEGTVSEPLCENSSWTKKNWVRTKHRDLTGVLFLSDYQEDTPFDSEYEVYGGKLEFPQHGFGFNPQRGTLLIYPSGPHFINATAAINYGDLYQVRFHIASHLPYMYDPNNFPGDYSSWFNNLD